MNRTCLVLMPAMGVVVLVAVGPIWRVSIDEVPPAGRCQVPFQPRDHIRQTAPAFQICEQKGLVSTHFARITLHHFE